MPTRFLLASALAALVAALNVANAAGPAAPRACHAAQAKPRTCVYQVADLVVGPASAEDLMGLIVNTVKPQSWGTMGGPGSVHYFPLTQSLVVSQTPDVQEQVCDLLASLHRLKDVQVALEVRVVTVGSSCFERVGVDFEAKPADEGGPKFLNDTQVRQFLEAAQGDRRTNVLQANKLVLANGQAGTIDATESKDYVTGVDLATEGREVATVQPKMEHRSTGLRMTALPRVSADRRSVSLALRTEQTELVEAPLVPIKLPIKDNQGRTAVFTQYVQQPKFRTEAAEQKVVVPDGGTMVLRGASKMVETRTEYGPPVLSQVPYVNRMFKNVGYGREEQQVLILVTPRVLVSEEAEEKKECAAPSTAVAQRSKALAELLKAYDAACAEGRAEEAGKLAQAALLLDPTCFKGRSTGRD